MDLFEQLELNTECVLCGCHIIANHLHKADQHKDQSDHRKIKRPSLICHFCHDRLPISLSQCFTCGLPLPNIESFSTKPTESIHKVCGACLTESPIFDRTISAFHYEYPINDFIAQLKYSAQLQVLPILCHYLQRAILDAYDKQSMPSLLIPVPLHRQKLTQRGFNQSRLLAHQLAKTLGIKVLKQGIERIKPTQAQSGLDSNERKANVKNAFKIGASLPRHVAIIDDVVTTGMTVSELTKQAKLSGAEQVDIWSVARAYEQ